MPHVSLFLRSFRPVRLAVAALAALVVSCGFGSRLVAVELADDLDLSAERSEGGGLNGAHLRDAAVSQWQATDNLIFTRFGSAGGVTNNNGTNFYARALLPTAKRRVEISVEAKTGERIHKDAWLAVGFGPNPQNFRYTWNGGVFLLLTPSGGYQGLANFGSESGTINLGTGQLADFSADNFTRLTLIYDVVANTVTAKLNGQVVIADFKLLGRGFRPELSVGGFSGFGQKNGTVCFKNFRVVTD